MSKRSGTTYMAVLAAAITLTVLADASRAAAPDLRPGFRPTVFAVEHGTITTEPGKVLEGATIVLRDGVIEAVGPDADIDVPFDAERIDGTGLFVYAGFIDVGRDAGIDREAQRSRSGEGRSVDYSSFALGATPEDNRNGMTPEFVVAEALKLDDEVAKPYREAGFTALLAAPRGGVATGQSALVSTSGLPRREVIIQSPVGLHVSLSSTGQRGYPSTLMGFTAHLRQAMLDAEHYERAWQFFREHGGPRPPVDPTYEALRAAQRREMPVFWHADERDEILRALALADEFGVQPIIVGGEEAWRVADELAQRQVPVVLQIDFPEEPKSTGGAGRRNSLEQRLRETPLETLKEYLKRSDLPVAYRDRIQARVDELENPGKAGEKKDDKGPQLPESPRVLEELKRKWRERVAGAKVLSEAGVEFCFTSEGHKKPGELAANLRRAIAAGLSTDAALMALTTDAAKIVGVNDRLGRLTAGHAAHVVVFDKGFGEETAKLRYAFIDAERFEMNKPSDKEAEKEDGEKPEAKAGEESVEKKETEQPAETNVAKQDDAAEGEAKKADTEPFPTEIEADRTPRVHTGGNVAIRGATILTVTEGTIEGGTIIVRDGKIAAVGSDVDIPDGTTVIDAAGLYVMPGIIDTHSHIAISGGVNEATLAVVPECRVLDAVNAEDMAIYRALAGGVTAARLLHGSANPIGGQDAVIKFKWRRPASELVVTDRPRGVKFALGENPKRSTSRYPDTRLGVESTIRRSFDEAKMYRRLWQRYAAARSGGEDVAEPRRDLRLEALADIVDGKLQIHSHCYRADEILMLMRLCESYGVRVRSLQHVLEGYKVAAEIAAHGASTSTFSDWWAYKVEAFDAIPYNAALLVEAGADVCLKSDDPELMRHLYQEASKTVKYGGMSEDQALAMVTINAAQQIGLDGRMGSIEVGKDADLAIFNAHPLHGFARCEMTLVDGEVYFERRGERVPAEVGDPIPAAELQTVEVDIEPAPSGTYALVGARIVPVVGSPIDRGTLIVANGRIKAVGDMSLAIPAGAASIDLAGLSVYPGMINVGGSLGLTEVGSVDETHDYDEKGTYNEDLRASIGVNPDSELIPVTRANGILTTLSQPSGGTISGQSVLMNLAGWIPPEMAVVDPMALHINMPRGLYASGDNAQKAREKAKKEIDELAERFELAIRYDELRRGALEHDAQPPTPDPKLEALAPYARGEKLVIIHAASHGDILAALALAKRLNIDWLLADADDAWKCVDELKEAGVGVILGPSMQLPASEYDPYDAPYANAAALYKAGVPFCIKGVSGGPGSATSYRNLPFQAAMAVAYELPADEGLKAVTLYPAQLLGVEDELGSIEVGKMANLVICDGNLLLPTTSVKSLFIAGNPVNTESKHTRLYARYRERLQEVRGGRVMLGVEPPQEPAVRASSGGR